MSIEVIKNNLPEYAKDVKLNISSVLTESGAMGLTQHQIAGIALACAYTTENQFVIKNISAFSEEYLTPEEMNGAKASSVIMAMNNVYYRFAHMVSDKDYETMPAKLRMNIMREPGVSQKDFELYSLAVSALNNCGYCMDSHMSKLTSAGISKEAIQSTIRIAAVIQSLAQTAVIEGL